ncbi:ABC transporter permease subunit [Candidimonas humi]|uniref:ABC transporter permease n=1 Tax=Candidimonas humi TaxID=683355 RepID=A0ABV8P2V7_9BURK|nr:ABC transporter permease subunit [Candidimonas humi]MBV6306695.1 ABC transporter permease subunit [Candidimonas humi]
MTRAIPLSASKPLSADLRPEYELQLEPMDGRRLPEGGATLPLARRILENGLARKLLILAALIAAWAGLAAVQNNALLLPGPLDTLLALYGDLSGGELGRRIYVSLSVLLRAYLLGVLLALVLTSLAISSRIGRDLLALLTSMFNPLPAIALLPLALLWFGLGQVSLIFVIIHSVLWALALNTYSGFLAVPATLRMTGRNYGLRGPRYVALVLVPAALPSILAGLRIGWAFAWRTLIAAELVFGTSSGQGGLGWYIYQNRNELYTDRVFAGLITVVLIGLLVENGIFDILERYTTRRWGMA